MRNFMRFLFPDADRDAIDEATLTIDDVAYDHAPAPGAAYPQSMRLAFKMTDPMRGPPQVYPLFPGQLIFLVDAGATGTMPQPDTLDLSSGYAGWKTRGTLMVVGQSAEVMKGLKDHLDGLAVVPTVLWYKGITLTEQFLLETLVKELKKEKIARGGGAPAVATSDADWPKHAVCGFLRGTYRPKLQLRASADQDEVVPFAMPVVTRLGDDSHELVITAAQPVDKPHDGALKRLADNTPDVEATDPSHARYGAVPARLLYRAARKNMLGASTGNRVADAVLADWPDAPRYFAFRCTRTWQVADTASVYFPGQIIRILRKSDSAELARQRMPVHGVFYLRQFAANPLPQAPTVQVEFEGGMTWVDGGKSDVWRVSGNTVPLQYDLAAEPSPHIQLRLQMSEAMLVEEADKPEGGRCTYMSMRRSLRALIDNRIAGGRLNYGRRSTGSATIKMIDAAWTGSEASSSLVANNRPLSELNPNQARKWLQPIFEAFFPDTGPAHTVGGSTKRDREFKLGRVAYELWQTSFEVLQSSGTRANFSDDHVGRGGPAALVATNVATFHVDLDRTAGEASDAYADRIVDAMMAELKPGAVLQFWGNYLDFEEFKNRTHSPPIRSWGHSLIFKGYLAANTGIRVIDQFGMQDCKIVGDAGARRIEWDGEPRDVWIAANWAE